MPHITIEYSANLDEGHDLNPMLHKVHEVLVKTLPASLASCKSRVFKCDDYLVGNGDSQNAFVHMSVKIMPGRTSEIKAEAAGLLLEVMQSIFSDRHKNKIIGYSIEIVELSSQYYKKYS